MQVSGLGDKEISPEKSPTGVKIIKVNGMASHDSVTVDTANVSYLASICSGAGIDIETFKIYKELCRQPTTNAARCCVRLDPDVIQEILPK